MKGYIAALVVLGVIAIAVLIYVEQSSAQTTRLHLQKIINDNADLSKIMGFNNSANSGGVPEPDIDVCISAPADYPEDIANNIQTGADVRPEKRRGQETGYVLGGRPTAPRARPVEPRGIVVTRHAADLAGQNIY